MTQTSEHDRTAVNPTNVYVHESGHAVVGIALGYELEDVSILIDRKTRLACGGGVIFLNQESISSFDSITIRMAGKAAEGAICPPIAERRGDKDQNDIDLELDKLKLKEPELSVYLSETELSSKAIIMTNSDVIIRMADIIAQTVMRLRSVFPDKYSIPCLHDLLPELQKVSPATKVRG